MVRTLDDAEDESERKVITDVAEFGWHVVQILEDDEGPAFAFTIGLGTTFGHPELLMIGQSLKLMHIVLNNLGHDIRAGKRFAHGDTSTDILEDFTCAFVRVSKRQYRDWLGFARWYYRGDEFETLQVVWPDKSNHLPWDDGVVSGMSERQPVLGDSHDA
jgi:hypothetical protein